MTQYDNGKTSVWYRADGKSQTAILDLVKGQSTLAQKVENLKALGVVGQGAVQVHQGAVGYSRAYESATVLWAAPSLPDTFYVESPVDYQGNHFVPPDAVLLDDAQTAKVTRSLFHGGWGDSMPLSANFSPRRGTDLPTDFDAAKSKTINSGYFKKDSFDDTRIFRVEGDLLWAIRKYAGQNGIDLNKSPEAIYGDQPAFDDPAFTGVTLNHKSNGIVPVAPGGLKAARPSLWLFPEAMYLEYKTMTPGGAPPHPDMVEIDPAEYVWLRQNKDDRELGIRPPEPPAVLEHLYVADTFLASGASHTALSYDYRAQSAMFKKLRAFEDSVFGQTNAGGAQLGVYGQRPMAEWLSDGAFKGFRFDWQPLNGPGRSRYAIPAQPVPADWAEVPGHPGVYLPDPARLPKEAAETMEFNLPPLQRRPQICGASPAITIRNPASKYPRADLQWPSIHTDYQIPGGPRYYIDAPKDYKGNIHRPDGAERLPKLQWEDFRASLGDMYEPDWIMPEPTAVPADFKRTRSRKADHDYFVLGGAALKAYRTFEALKEDSDEQRRVFMKSLGDTGSYSYFGKTLTSVEFKTPPGAGWVPAQGSGRNAYAPDPSTPEGLRAIQDFANLPERPDHYALHALLYLGSPDKVQPYLHQLPARGLIVVAYKPGSVAQAPDGARRMDGDMFGWLQEEARDIQSGMKTPPMPQAIADFLQECRKPPAQLPPAAPRLPGPA